MLVQNVKRRGMYTRIKELRVYKAKREYFIQQQEQESREVFARERRARVLIPLATPDNSFFSASPPRVFLVSNEFIFLIHGLPTPCLLTRNDFILIFL